MKYIIAIVLSLSSLTNTTAQAADNSKGKVHCICVQSEGCPCEGYGNINDTKKKTRTLETVKDKPLVSICKANPKACGA